MRGAEFSEREVQELRQRLERIRRMDVGRKANEQIRLIGCLIRKGERRVEKNRNIEQLKQRIMSAERKDLDVFEATIKQYLDERAANDELFANKFASDANKSIEDCCRFIYGVVRKAGRMGWTDEEIFGLAVHYYEEDDIQVEENVMEPQRVVSNHDVEFTEEEIQEMRKEAEKEYKRKLVAEYERKAEESRKKKAEAKKVMVDVEMPTLF